MYLKRTSISKTIFKNELEFVSYIAKFFYSKKVLKLIIHSKCLKYVVLGN